MSANLDRIATVDISLDSPISNEANFDNILILGPAPANHVMGREVPLVGVYNSIGDVTDIGFRATGEGADPIGVAARVAFSQTPRPREVYIAYTGRKPMPSTSVVKVPGQSISMNLGDKITSDLIGEDVRITEDGTVLGTIKNAHWEEFGKKTPDLQTGHYFPILLPAGGTTLKTTGQHVKTQAFPKDRLLCFYVKDNSSTCKIEIDDHEVITLNFRCAKLEGVETPIEEAPTVPCTVIDVLEEAAALGGWYCVCPTGLSDAETREVIEWTETQNKICGYIEDDPVDSIVEPGLYLRSYAFYPKTTEDQTDDDIPLENRYGIAVSVAAKSMAYHSGQETWALKSLSLISPATLSANFINKLSKANISYVMAVAGKNVTMGGKTNGGEWIDVIRFRDWLQNDMQVRVVNLLVTNPKIPYTDGGIGLVENQMLASLKDGQSYGGIAPDEYASDGSTIHGYVTSVPLASELSSEQKASRVLEGCRFSARLAGAVHLVEIKGSLHYENLT